MSTIEIYHGSEFVIKKPLLGFGNIHNDYGQGFYCTEQLNMSKEWACKKGHNGYSNAYTLELTGLKILNLLDAQYNVLNWMALLLANRSFRLESQLGIAGKKYLLENFLPDIAGYDIIKGYRADDSYFAFAQAFIENTLSLQALNKAIYLGKLGEQIVLRTEKAYINLHFTGAEVALAEEYYPIFKLRDSLARKKYRDELAVQAPHPQDVYMLDIMRGRWQAHDLRL